MTEHEPSDRIRRNDDADILYFPTVPRTLREFDDSRMGDELILRQINHYISRTDVLRLDKDDQVRHLINSVFMAIESTISIESLFNTDGSLDRTNRKKALHVAEIETRITQARERYEQSVEEGGKFATGEMLMCISEYVNNNKSETNLYRAFEVLRERSKVYDPFRDAIIEAHRTALIMLADDMPAEEL